MMGKWPKRDKEHPGRRRRRPAATPLLAALVVASTCRRGPLLVVAAAAAAAKEEPPLLRARAHVPPTLVVDAEDEEDAREEGGSASSASSSVGVVDVDGGMATRDSHGLLVEIASPPREQQQQEEGEQQQQTKIVNGGTRPRSSHPYIARLHWSNPGPDTYFCGASLITPNVLLTAAHCVDDSIGVSINDFRVDILDLDDGTTRNYRIIDSRIHPEYVMGVPRFDIALALLKSTHLDVVEEEEGGRKIWNLVNSYDWSVSPPLARLHRTTGDEYRACTSLTPEESFDVTTLDVIGYGTTSMTSMPSYDKLRWADVHYVSNDVCDDMYRRDTKTTRGGRIITDDMMCAGDTKEIQDACSGDSGGPLIAYNLPMEGEGQEPPPHLHTLVGVVSWGNECADPRYPGVYSRVSYGVEWIDRTICGDPTAGEENGGGGMSPMSCVDVADGVGGWNRRPRDYAIEDVTAPLPGGRGRGRRRTGSDDDDATGVVVGERSSTIDGGGDGTRRREKIDFTFEDERQRQSLSDSCELMEGAQEGASTPPPSPPPTPRPTNPPASTTISTTCSRNNKLDVTFAFPVKNNGNKMRDCEWVGRRCRARCLKYSKQKRCCPETCGACE